jgi:hypothetical protein
MSSVVNCRNGESGNGFFQKRALPNRLSMVGFLTAECHAQAILKTLIKGLSQ